MSLFHNKTIQGKLARYSEIPIAHQKSIDDWNKSIGNGTLAKQGEKSAHPTFISQILVGLLGYKSSGGNEQWTADYETTIGSGSVDVALGRFDHDKTTDQVIAPFELKGLDTKDLDHMMSGRHKTPVQQAWEYANDARGAKWVLVSNYREIRLYAVSHGRQTYEKWQLAELGDLKEYARLQLLLAESNLLSGNTEDLLIENEKVEKDITDRLYADYKQLRFHLVTDLQQGNPEVAALSIISYAQTILDRIIFIAFAEDIGLLPARIMERAYEHSDPFNPRPVWENFKGLFTSIDKGNSQLSIPAYNGGLFAAHEALNALEVSDELCERFRDIGRYDFASEVSVTVLGHIFEQSISDLENLQDQVLEGKSLEESAGKQHAVKGKRKQHGVVYTPDHITLFIVEQTLGSYLRQEFEDISQAFLTKKGELKQANKEQLKLWYTWRERLQDLRIVDPACGSGAFLVAAFDYLSAEFKRVNDKLHDLTGSYDVFDLNKQILNKNLYGVDLNAESIEITKLSLWLKTAQHGKPLESLDHSIRCGNSLIDEKESDSKAFDWKQEFPEVFTGEKEDEGFDVVLGNPPYVRQERISPIKPYLENNYAVYHGVADLYCYFFELGLKLLKPQGRLGYISSNTFFKTSSGKPLRLHLLKQAELRDIVDFGDLQIFEGVTTYPAILVMDKVKKAKADSKTHFLNLKDEVPNDLLQSYKQHSASMLQSQLNEDNWRLESESLASLRSKIVKDKPSLKEAYGSPYRGVLTGYNDAFVIDAATREKLVKEDFKSDEILKPFLEGKDLKKWQVESRNLYLILFPKGWTKKQLGSLVSEEEAWEWLCKNYPAISNWLSPLAEKAKKRGDKGEYWWELRACAYYEKFEKEKIIYPDISQTPNFSFDEGSNYFANTGYFLPSGNRYVIGVLNSKLFWFFFKGVSNPIRGGFYRMFSQYLETSPIPNASETKKIAIGELAKSCEALAAERYTKQHDFRIRIPDLCPEDRPSKLSKKLQNWWEHDFATFRKEIKRLYKQDIPLQERSEWEKWIKTDRGSIQQLNSNLRQQEDKLNALVYELFELTVEEIELLEESLK